MQGSGIRWAKRRAFPLERRGAVASRTALLEQKGGSGVPRAVRRAAGPNASGGIFDAVIRGGSFPLPAAGESH